MQKIKIGSIFKCSTGPNGTATNDRLYAVVASLNAQGEGVAFLASLEFGHSYAEKPVPVETSGNKEWEITPEQFAAMADGHPERFELLPTAWNEKMRYVVEKVNIFTTAEDRLKQLYATDPLLGKKLRDKITGFEGIGVTKLTCLFGCDQYGIVPQTKPEEKDGKMVRPDTEYFDEGRLEVTGEGVRPSEVQSAAAPGADFNADAPNH